MLDTITQLFILITLILPPAQVDLPLRDRLFYDFHGHEFQGRDLFPLISEQRYLFWLNTGETPETFLAMARETAAHFILLTRRGNPRQRMHGLS